MILELITAFTVKHFLCDFPLQRWPYMYLNKGIYGHPGGMLHASIHGIFTALILAVMTPISWTAIISFAAFDYGTHYHIDWAKIKLMKVYNLKPDNSEWYWYLLGLDQMLHYLAYIFIIYGVA